MSRTSNIYVRIEPELKEQAEEVLNQIGIPMSNAIGLFLRQVVFHRGLPFEVKAPRKKPLSLGEMTEEQFYAMMKEGIDDVKAGRTVSAEEVEEGMFRDYGIKLKKEVIWMDGCSIQYSISSSRALNEIYEYLAMDRREPFAAMDMVNLIQYAIKQLDHAIALGIITNDVIPFFVLEQPLDLC